MDATISIDRIREAAGLIDPVFRDSPQFVSEPLSQRFGTRTVLKVECVNPIRSFKGRGTDYLLHRLDGAAPLVCASAGNFGQGMAYACRKRGRRLTVFAGSTANPLKVERMRSLGAEVVIEGEDFDSAKDAAKLHAREHGEIFVEDGLHGAVAEGAGTIAVELLRMSESFDAVFVPVGDGALINGIGTWLREYSPATRVIAVVAAAAPAMELSFRAGRPISAGSSTIADGVAVRVPVPEAVELMRGLVDEVMTVGEDEILSAMRMAHAAAGLVIEPAGATGVAAIAQRKGELAGRRVATVLTGGNLTEAQMREWLLPV